MQILSDDLGLWPMIVTIARCRPRPYIVSIMCIESEVMQSLDFKDVISDFASDKARKVPLERLHLFVVQFRCSLLVGHNNWHYASIGLLLLTYIWKCCHLDLGTWTEPAPYIFI